MKYHTIRFSLGEVSALRQMVRLYFSNLLATNQAQLLRGELSSENAITRTLVLVDHYKDVDMPLCIVEKTLSAKKEQEAAIGLSQKLLEEMRKISNIHFNREDFLGSDSADGISTTIDIIEAARPFIHRALAGETTGDLMN